VSVQLHIENMREQQIKFCTACCQQFKRFSDECQLPSQYLNRVFKMSTSCSNIRSKFVVKCYDCLINEFLWQIIPYRQWSSLQLGNVGQKITDSVLALHPIGAYMIIQRHIHLVNLLLFLLQSCSLITCSL